MGFFWVKLSVLIPIYNEKQTISEIIDCVRKIDFDLEIIAVDDASSDGTKEILENLAQKFPPEQFRVFFHEKNQGKGAAVRTAIQEATGDILIIQDADLEYDPKEYPRLIDPIVQGKADVVYGSRFLGGPHRVLFFWHYLANQFLTLLSNAFNNINLTDMETCYKVFRAEVLKGIQIRQNRFGFEPEITAKIARRKYRMFEIPISYYGRDYSEGKKIGWRDGVAAIYFIIRYGLFD
jgi:glycosyltransferase involved in cell wall biosynthesis